jgi:hypothetical protein
MDDPNDLHYVFGNPRHNLDQFVRRHGSEEFAGQEIDAAVDSAFISGNLILDDTGLYKQVFDIGGSLIIVSGCVVNGIVRVGTAWSPL